MAARGLRVSLALRVHHLLEKPALHVSSTVADHLAEVALPGAQLDQGARVSDVHELTRPQHRGLQAGQLIQEEFTVEHDVRFLWPGIPVSARPLSQSLR